MSSVSRARLLCESPPRRGSPTEPHRRSDAIFRYLLVQYGFTPTDLLSMENGAVVGDVL